MDEVWANWEKIKRAEKTGTHLERKSAFDGIPKHMPALQRAEKLAKKARKTFGSNCLTIKSAGRKLTKKALARQLFELAAQAQARGWSAEELLTGEINQQEKKLRRAEAKLPD